MTVTTYNTATGSELIATIPTTAILNVDPKTGYISAMKMRSP